MRTHPATLSQGKNLLSAAKVSRVFLRESQRRGKGSLLRRMRIAIAPREPIPNTGTSSGQNSPDFRHSPSLFLEYFFDLPDLFFNFAGDPFGAALIL
jgi:hypothetical protein